MMKRLLNILKKPRMLLALLFGTLIVSCAFSISVTIGLFIDQYLINESLPAFVDDEEKQLRCFPLTQNGNWVAVEWAGDENMESDTITIPNTVYKRTAENTREPYTVKAIKKAGFRNCDFIKHVLFDEDGSTVDEIQEEAFYSCQNLIDFQFPEKCVRGIGSSAFMDCRKLSKVFMTGLTSYINGQQNLNTFLTDNKFVIGDHAFASCVTLVGFSFPKNLSEIGESAFAGCKQLYSVILPEPVGAAPNYVNKITIGKYAFADCSNLSIFNFGKNVTKIDSYAFAECPNKLKIYYVGTFLENTTESGDKNPLNASYDLEFRKKHVGHNVSNGNVSIADDYVRITLADSFFTIHPDYPGFTFIKQSIPILYQGDKNHGSTIPLDSDPGQYINITSFVPPDDFEYECYYSEVVPGSDPEETIKVLKIPDSIDGIPVKKIEHDAFYPDKVEGLNSSHIEKVIFNQQLVQISYDAFHGCKDITDLDFTACENLREIGTKAFESTGCAMNKPLLLPSSLYYIGYHAFYKFTKVTKLNLCYDENNATPVPHLRLIGNEAFYQLGSDENNASNYGKTDLVFPYTLTDGNVADAKPEGYDSNNGEINLASTWYWPSVGYKAFAECPLIRSITMQPHPAEGDGSELVQQYADTKNDHIIGTKDDTRTSFGNQCFSKCANLETFVCNKMMSRLGSGIFEGCESMKELFISTWANRNVVNKSDRPYDGFTLGNGEGASLFFTVNSGADDDDCEYRDLIIYVAKSSDDLDTTAKDYIDVVYPRRANQPKNIVWNSDPKTFKNEYASSEDNTTRVQYTGANLYNDSVIGRTIVPTYYGVEYEDVHYLNPETGAEITRGAGFNYDKTAAYITRGDDAIITRCYTSSTLSEIDMQKWNTTRSISIKTIGSCAFATQMNNKNPSSKIILPSSVTKIKDRAFYSINGTDVPGFSSYVSTVTYKNNNVEVANSMGNCHLPTNVTNVEKYAFYNNTFGQITLPSSLAFFGNTAFTRSPGLDQNITGFDTSNNFAFSDSHFAYVNNGSGLAYIENNKSALLYYAKGTGVNPTFDLTATNDTKNIAIIGARALANTNYTSINLGSKITTLEGGAFGSNRFLTSVTGLSGLKYIGGYTSTKESDNGSPRNGNTYYDLYDYYYETYGGETLQTGNKYRSNRFNYYEWIGKFGVFANCTNLTTMNFDQCYNSLIKIGYGAFENCSSLYNLTSGNKNYAYYKYVSGINQYNVDSKIASGALTTNHKYTSGVKNSKGVLDLRKHTKLTSIGRNAFYGCSSINFIHLPMLYSSDISIDSQAKFYLGFDWDDRGSWYGSRSQNYNVFYGSGADDVDTGAVLVGESALFACSHTASEGKYKYPSNQKIGKTVDEYDSTDYNNDRYHEGTYNPATTYFFVRPGHVKEDLYFGISGVTIKYWTYINGSNDNTTDCNIMLFNSNAEVLKYYEHTLKVNDSVVLNTTNLPYSNSSSKRFVVTLTADSTIDIITYDIYGNPTSLTVHEGSDAYSVAGEYVITIDCVDESTKEYATEYTIKQYDISISGPTEFYTGYSDPLTATPETISDLIEWTSSDEEVATVDSNGVVTGVAPGSATITATSGSLSASHNITVVTSYMVVINDTDHVALIENNDGKPGDVDHQYVANIVTSSGDELSFYYGTTPVSNLSANSGNNLDNNLTVIYGSTGDIYLKDMSGNDNWEVYFAKPDYHLFEVDGEHRDASRTTPDNVYDHGKYYIILDNGETFSVIYGNDTLLEFGHETGDYEGPTDGASATGRAQYTVYINSYDEVYVSNPTQKDYYLRGDAVGGWGTEDLVDTNRFLSYADNQGALLNVHIGLGEFKIASSDWNTYQWNYTNPIIGGAASNFSAGDSDNNIKCDVAGYYNIYVTNDNKISFELVEADPLE